MEDAELELLDALCPVIAAAGDNGRLSVSGWIFPFLGYQSKTKTAQLAQENSDMVEKILLAEGRDEYTGMSGDDTEKNAPTDGRNLSLEGLARLENEQAGGQKSGQNGAAGGGSETDGGSAASDREGQSSGRIEIKPDDSQNETGDTANSSDIGDLQPLSRRSSVPTTGRSLRVMMSWCGNFMRSIRQPRRTRRS